ncbi:MAG: cell division FtsA domain-containing protein, partial [Flavobacteriaceae bacterium]|nr:cell division FtsA domain-containing protein [Flavobacteriaceae bacterium]
TLKNLSKIIHARVVEIVEQVYLEIKNYGHEEQKKKLIGGIVLTGGGSQLKHLKQLVEYITGMDTRIGYPNEHLAGDSDSETTSPMYATAVGLVLNSLENQMRASEMAQLPHDDVEDNAQEDENVEEVVEEKEAKDKKRFFDKWAEKFKEFLDNAE